MPAPDPSLAVRLWRIPLEQIEVTVAAHLGPGRVPGNERVPCFSRQVSMYLAKHVGGWSTTKIGRFYNGRHHTTVLHAIQKIEQLRKQDDSVDALLDVLGSALGQETDFRTSTPPEPKWRDLLVDAITERVMERLGAHRSDSLGQRALRSDSESLGDLKLEL